MSPPDGAAAPRGRPLRVISERVSAEEAERVRATPSVTRFASHSAPTAAPPPADAASAVTTVLPTTTAVRVQHPSAPLPAPALPVLAPRRPRRRMAELVRMVFARRNAGRHRPETTLTQSWSMFAPQRRPRRWGRR